ncbi:MAG: hypothetical protein AAB668_01175 [Patescibacteria group bacterium]
MRHVNRFDLVINTESLEERDNLLQGFNLVGKLIDEEAFYALVEKSKATEEAGVEGLHIRKRITHGEQRVAEATRKTEMKHRGIKPEIEGLIHTGELALPKEGVEFAVIDGLLDQLEVRFDLFGFRLEQKAVKYTAGEVKDARRKGLDVKFGDFKKSEKGGEVFLWKFRFLFFTKGSVPVVQTELMQLLREYGSQAIVHRARCYYNGDFDAVELLLGYIPPILERVTRVLYDGKGFYVRSIPNNRKGRVKPIERRPSLKASLEERVGGKKLESKNGDTPPPAS